jgi:hypothetical protein
MQRFLTIAVAADIVCWLGLLFFAIHWLRCPLA